MKHKVQRNASRSRTRDSQSRSGENAERSFRGGYPDHIREGFTRLNNSRRNHRFSSFRNDGYFDLHDHASSVPKRHSRRNFRHYEEEEELSAKRRYDLGDSGIYDNYRTSRHYEDELLPNDHTTARNRRTQYSLPGSTRHHKHYRHHDKTESGYLYRSYPEHDRSYDQPGRHHYYSSGSRSGHNNDAGYTERYADYNNGHLQAHHRELIYQPSGMYSRRSQRRRKR